VKPKQGFYVFWLFFKIDLYSAISFKRSSRELSIDVAKHRSALNNTVQQNLGLGCECLVPGVLTVGLYSLVIKTTETVFFSAVKIRLGSGGVMAGKGGDGCPSSRPSLRL